MTGAETIAAAIIDAAHILARALESSEWREDARSGPNSPGPVQTDPPAAHDAPNGLKEHLDAQTPWRDIRDALGEHRYRGDFQSFCTCGWTHAGSVDPVGEWLDHVTDAILAELGLS